MKKENIEKSSDSITLLIPERLITDNNFSNYSLATYCILHSLALPTKMPIQCIAYPQIEFYLTGKISKRRIITDYIKRGLNELVDQQIVKKIDETQKCLILDCSKLWIDIRETNFIKIVIDEVQQIFKVKNTNNFLLLRYFVLLISTISSKITVYLESGEFKNRVVGNFTIEYLAKLTGVSEKTAIEYNKILEEIGLIYIYRQNDFVISKEDRSIKRLNNIYGRACDIEYITTYANNQQKYHESYRYVENNNKKANTKRRLAQMYQQILKGNDNKYSNAEIISVYEYVVSENEKYERMYEQNQNEEYLDKIRDIDIFDKYDFVEK